MKLNILLLLGVVAGQEKPRVITLQEAVEELLGGPTATVETIQPGQCQTLFTS